MIIKLHAVFFALVEKLTFQTVDVGDDIYLRCAILVYGSNYVLPNDK